MALLVHFSYLVVVHHFKATTAGNGYNGYNADEEGAIPCAAAMSFPWFRSGVGHAPRHQLLP